MDRKVTYSGSIRNLRDILGLFWGFFSEDSGFCQGRGGERLLLAMGRARWAFLRLIQAHRFLPPDSLSFLATEGKHPRGSRILRKVIVVHGELREMIPDVSGRRGIGLGNCSCLDKPIAPGVSGGSPPSR